MTIWCFFTNTKNKFLSSQVCEECVPRVSATRESFSTFLWEKDESESQSQKDQCNGMCRLGGQDLAAFVSHQAVLKLRPSEAVLPFHWPGELF